MKVHIMTPYSLEKNLGRAYNEAMSLIPDDDFGCLIDHDVMFLTPDSGHILHEYAKRFPTAGVFTCFTNRVSELSKYQLLNAMVNEDSDIKNHIRYAATVKKSLYSATLIHRDISGFLMMISKRIWNEHKFSEDLKCLGVDTEWNRRLRAAGKTILRMDGLYVFHTYRIMTNILDRNHLK